MQILSPKCNVNSSFVGVFLVVRGVGSSEFCYPAIHFSIPLKKNNLLAVSKGGGFFFLSKKEMLSRATRDAGKVSNLGCVQ